MWLSAALRGDKPSVDPQELTRGGGKAGSGTLVHPSLVVTCLTSVLRVLLIECYLFILKKPSKPGSVKTERAGAFGQIEKQMVVRQGRVRQRGR